MQVVMTEPPVCGKHVIIFTLKTYLLRLPSYTVVNQTGMLKLPKGPPGLTGLTKRELFLRGVILGNTLQLHELRNEGFAANDVVNVLADIKVLFKGQNHSLAFPANITPMLLLLLVP